MKAYCGNCGENKPASFRPSKDYVSGLGYEDLCCDECHFIIASIEDRNELLHLAASERKEQV
jgi:hypothetical protein